MSLYMGGKLCNNAGTVSRSVEEQMSRSPGRPRSPFLRSDWKISLPAALAAEVELRLLDPLTKKPGYAARSRLIEELLKRWLSDTPDCNIPLSTLTYQQEVSDA